MNDSSVNKWSIYSDSLLMGTIGEYIKRHRLAQNKTQDEVAHAAGISRSTLSLLERGETVTTATLLQTLRVLGLLSVMENFEWREEVSPLAMLRRERQKRQRARHTQHDAA